MASVSVYNMEGAQVGTIELSDSIFAVPVNEHLVHQAVVAQLANKRQGTQKAKTALICFVLISANFNSSNTMNLLSLTLDVKTDFIASCFSFLFIITE